MHLLIESRLLSVIYTAMCISVVLSQWQLCTFWWEHSCMLSCGSTSTDNRSHLRVSRQWVECCSLQDWHQDETAVFTGKAVCSLLVCHYRSSEKTRQTFGDHPVTIYTRGETRLPFCYWSPRIWDILFHSLIPKKTYLCFFNIINWNLFHTLWGNPVQLCLRDR